MTSALESREGRVPIKGEAHTPDLDGFVFCVIKPTSDLGSDAKTNIYVHLQPGIKCGMGDRVFLDYLQFRVFLYQI